jgi:hypothetical protein
VKFLFFPRLEYTLNSPLSAIEASETLAKTVFNRREADFFDRIDELVDNTTRTYRYFQGKISGLNFRIRRNSSIPGQILPSGLTSTWVTPIISGQIISKATGSIIHVSVRINYFTYVCISLAVLGCLFGMAHGYSTNNFKNYLIMSIASISMFLLVRMEYLRQNERSKQELKEILKAEETKNSSL